MSTNNELQLNQDELVEQIVNTWNTVVENFQNTTLSLSLMINEKLAQYPDASVKEILEKVKSHPRIKRFVSLDRIWQGVRLLKSRPEIVEYVKAQSEEERKVIAEKNNLYLKKDGDLFVEYYFEIAKQPLNDGILVQIEQEGVNEKWSYRDLRKKLQEVKDEMASPGAYISSKEEKRDLLKLINIEIRMLQPDQLREILKKIRSLKEGYRQGKEPEKDPLNLY